MNMLKIYTTVSALVCLVFFLGCRGVYEGFKSTSAEECYKLAYPDQEQCLQQVQMSYEEYEKERAGRKRSQ